MGKSLQLVMLLLLVNTVVYAQYVPFAEEDKFWIYLNYDAANQDIPKRISGHAITLLGDTTINALAYKKVYRLNLKGGHNCPPADQPCWDFDYPYQTESTSLDGFIREDIAEKKVYYLNNTDASEEDVLFDFSLEVGDTVNNHVYESIWAKITNTFPGGIVDSTKLVETHGQLRNSIFTYGYYTIIGLPYEMPIVISEGLGYKDFGIFYKPQSEFVDYCEGDKQQCNLLLSNEVIAAKQDIKIYPNPSHGIFNIETKSKVTKLRLYSMLGQLKLETESTDKIDLSHVENGMYFIEINTANDARYFKMIQKKSGL